MQPRSNVMVISTQTPTTSASTVGIAPGKTGQIIQNLTNGGFVHLHRDKKLRENEVKEFDHFKSGGWLIITGHGLPGTEQIVGAYTNPAAMQELLKNPSAPIKMDIEISAKDYVDLVMSSNALKRGDQINVLLYVCYAAKPLDNKKSFAVQLADEFASRGITSHIVASVNPVGRIGDFDGPNDKKGEQLNFRADKKDIRYIEAGPGQPTTESSPQHDILITKNGISSNDVNFEKYKKILGKLSSNLTSSNFLKDRVQTEYLLNTQPNLNFIIRQGSNGDLILSFKDDNQFHHVSIANKDGLKIPLSTVSDKINHLKAQTVFTPAPTVQAPQVSPAPKPTANPNERLSVSIQVLNEEYQSFKNKFPELGKYLTSLNDFSKNRTLAEQTIDLGASFILRKGSQEGVVLSFKENGEFQHVLILPENSAKALAKIQQLNESKLRSSKPASSKHQSETIPKGFHGAHGIFKENKMPHLKSGKDVPSHEVTTPKARK